MGRGCGAAGGVVSAWTDFVWELARLPDEADVEEINGRLTDRHLQAWIAREVDTTSEYQLLNDALEELDHDLDGERDLNGLTAKILLNAITDRNPQTVVWRILRDSLRRCAIRDAGREADTERLAIAERKADEKYDRADWEHERRKDRMLEERWEREQEAK